MVAVESVAALRGPTVAALMPFPLASSPNCVFHASKPAAVLPHCAAPALPASHTSATKAATVVVLSCPLVMENSHSRPLHQGSRACAEGTRADADGEAVAPINGSQPFIRIRPVQRPRRSATFPLLGVEQAP